MDSDAPHAHPRRDALAGVLLIVAGAGVALEASRYGFGTLARMGPGLFPCALGLALALVGALIALARNAPGGEAHEAVAAPDWRGWACIIGGIVLFIVLGEHAGLGPATFACVLVSALGDRTATWRSALLLALVCTLIAGLVFAMLLHFQMPFLRGWGR